MTGKARLVSLALLASVWLAVAVTPAQSYIEIAEKGTGAGMVKEPLGMALDSQSGRLYVADRGNNRIDVFEANGDFAFAFGWGVRDGTAEPQSCTTATGCRSGRSGSGSGQFNSPMSVAIDNDPASSSQGTIYVGDTLNNRVQKFSPDGDFILMMGGGVNRTKAEEGKVSEEDLCTASSGDLCGDGTDGFGAGEFSSNIVSGETPIFVGVGPAGTVYVVDTRRNFNIEFRYRVQKFQPSGVPVGLPRLLWEGSGAFGLGVAPNGEFYVGSESVSETTPMPVLPDGGIHRYDASGNEVAAIDQPLQSLAVDLSTDHVFAVGNRVGEGGIGSIRRSLVELGGANVPVARFGYGEVGEVARGIAAYDAEVKGIYVAVLNAGIRRISLPDPGPIVFPEPCRAEPLGNTQGTLFAEINPEGEATGYHFELVSEEEYQHDVADLGPGHGFDHATRVPGQPSEDPALPADFELHEATAEADLLPETAYRCRVIASNADGAAEGPEGSFTSLPPLEIGDTWASAVGTEAATLNVEVNPLGIPTSGYFQYVDEATYQHDLAELGPGHGFDHAMRAPDPGAGEQPLDFGQGNSMQAAAASVAGLAPDTAYRYRLLATDPLISPREVAGPVKALRTFALGEGALADSRAFELVSPPQKGSAEVGIPGKAAGLYAQEKIVRIQAAAGSGEAVTYTSWTSFGEPEGAPSASQYLSKRGASGWQTENVSPFGTLENPLEPPYRGFSPDLAFAGLVVGEPALAPGAQDGVENLYLRDNASGALRALTTQPPLFTPAPLLGDSFRTFCSVFAGSSADGTRAFFASNGAMAGAPVGNGMSLYEWSAQGGLALLSVLPSGAPAAPAIKSGFGAGRGICSISQRIVAHAVSADGSVAFWTYGGKFSGASEPLFARIGGSETVQLDAKAKGALGPSGEGTFWAATADGARAFLTAPGRLTVDAGAGGHLFRYDTASRALLDLTPGPVAPDIEGVVGASADGTYLYFVASAALAGGSQAGGNNLYLWHEGEGLRFIAALSDLDQAAWDPAPSGLRARVSPGGDLAFLSVESEALSSYDSTILGGGGCEPRLEGELKGDPRCAQAYLYDAGDQTLTCVSCNPSGARPSGPADLPVWSNPLEGPRYLSADGSRLFFESRDALSDVDRNDRRDVYEFERAGSGDCSAQNPAFDPASGGCVTLLSGGSSSDESYLVDASADGRDVFISTREQLVGWDTNPNYDVYDARIGGGFPEPPPPPAPCEGEACLPPGTLPPAIAPPASATFQGPGNVTAKPKKGKGKKGKANKKKHKSGKRKSKKRGNNHRPSRSR